MTPTTTTTRFTLTIVLPLVAAAIIIVAVARNATVDPPMKRTADAIAALFEPGDIVLLYPETRFPDLELFDDRVDAIATSSLPAELNRFERVILVRDRSDQPPAMRRMLAGRARLLFAEDIGPLTFELFQLNEPERVVVDLMDSIRTAQASFVPRGTARGSTDHEAVECPWLADRFDCGEGDWTWIGLTSQVFAGEPHRCVWMHPVDGGDVVLEFPVVSGTHVTGWYGLTDYAVSIPDGSAVRLELAAGDETGRFRAHRQTGRRPLRFELPEDYMGPLTVSVSAPRAGVRHFCWNLQVVASGEP